MIPVKQTILHDPDNGKIGNCFSAVVASLLHIPIEEIPTFSDKDTWVLDVNAWLRDRGFCYMTLDVREWGKDGAAQLFKNFGVKNLYHEVAGPTSRFEELHACVGLDGNLVFDPHPSDDGLKEIHYIGLFFPLNPSIPIGIVQ